MPPGGHAAWAESRVKDRLLADVKESCRAVRLPIDNRLIVCYNSRAESEPELLRRLHTAERALSRWSLEPGLLKKLSVSETISQGALSQQLIAQFLRRVKGQSAE